MKQNQLTAETSPTSTSSKNENLSGILSLFIPGAGQLYNRKIGWALFWFVLTPGLWIATQGIAGLAIHVFAAIQAYRQSIRINWANQG